MSYDCGFGVKLEGCDDMFIFDRPEHDSPTYNLRTIFCKAMDFEFEQGKWYPLSDMLPLFQRAEIALRDDPQEFKKYEPENGWGTVATAILCFSTWSRDAADKRDWGWEGIPFEKMWWRW